MKDIIEVLKNEHENIRNKIDDIEKDLILFMEEDVIDINKFRDYIEFIRNYADKKHHQKEEDILFNEMLKELGSMAEKLIKNGMLVEHNLARLYVYETDEALKRYADEKNLKDKLCIIGNMASYIYLLRRHIDKENDVVYPYAKNNLPNKVMDELSKQAEAYDTNLDILYNKKN